YLICDALCDKYGQGDLRATSRQDFQFHGVVKGNLRLLIHDLNTLSRIMTFGGCGDVVRNTMAPPVADIDARYKDCGADLLAVAREISDRFLPRTTSYFDLWINDEKATVNPDGTISFRGTMPEKPVEEPLYGAQYLPRKFKIGLAADFDNSVDVYTNDVGVLAVTEGGRIVGYEILAGGGMGFSHAKKNTYPRLGSPVAFVPYDDVIPICEAIIKTQRDYGERTDRKQARLKYTIDRMGLDAFVKLIETYAGRRFDPPRNVRPTAQPDYLGWHKQSQDGLNYVGVWIENGRIRDFEDSHQFRSGLRAVVERYRSDVRVTPHHNLVLANVADADVASVQALLDEYGIPTDRGISTIRRQEMACPALPYCGLAQSEAERALPTIMRGLEAAGYGDLDVSIRMTGCPNGCARSSTSEIGLIGKGPERYILNIAGDYNGTRLNTTLIPTIKFDDIVPTLSRLFDLWKEQREDGERFGDWAHRIGTEQVLKQMGIEVSA
ncbi:MAG TPA: NADPH-dependent assimilatory sulfite reductase hemoprotein subunit, partial [Candidatus Hydrogenedentes bacterium]|nr:NADPH-dependent assimilatory sulfite reductase hemoprotein subunit [Candidatus Hydrogenedentota bacterium]